MSYWDTYRGEMVMRHTKDDPSAFKAYKLFYNALDQKEREELDSEGYVSIPYGRKVYRIGPAYGTWVYCYDKGSIPERDCPLSKYCVAPDIYVPMFDTTLAQYLYLKCKPRELLKRANVFSA